MKKIYWKPEIEIMNVELEQMIAGSLGSMAADGGPVDLNDEDPDGDVLSRILNESAF